MDGKLLHTMAVETKPSKLVYFNPYSEEEFRLYLPEGDHVFRVGFIKCPFCSLLQSGIFFLVNGCHLHNHKIFDYAKLRWHGSGLL